QRKRPARRWRNRSPSGVSTCNGGNKLLALSPTAPKRCIWSAHRCQPCLLIYETRERERRRERGCMQHSLLSLENGSRFSHREAGSCAPSRSRCTSRIGGTPKKLLYSRLKCEVSW